MRAATDTRAIPRRNRVVVALFLVAWGFGQANVAWEGALGKGATTHALFVSSAEGPEDYPRVDTDGRFDAAWRWSPRWMRGDELVRVDEADLQGLSAAEFTRVLKGALRTSGQAEIEWVRDGRRAVEVYPAQADWGWAWALPLSIASALTAVLLLLRAPHWPLSWLGFLFFAGLASFAQAPGIFPGFMGVREALQLAARPLCGAAAILIAVRFPDSPPPAKRWDLVLAAVVAASILGLYLVLGYGPFRGFVYGSAALLAAFGVTMSALLSRTYRRTDPVGRRQIRWVLYGALVALGMLVFGNLAFLIDPPLLFWAGVPMILGFTALPLGFLIAVFGSRFLDVDPLISSATSYFLLGVGLLVSIEVVVPPIASLAGQLTGVAPASAELALAIAFVFLSIPVHRFLRPRIERFFFPERPAFEDGIHDLLDEISEIDDPERLIEHAGMRLAGFLNTRVCLVFESTSVGYEARYVLGAETPPSIGDDTALVAALRERSAPLASDRLSRRDRIGRLPRDEQALLASLGIQVVVPLRSRGRLLGFVCLGAKRSGDVYTSTELALLTAVTNVLSARLVSGFGS